MISTFMDQCRFIDLIFPKTFENGRDTNVCGWLGLITKTLIVMLVSQPALWFVYSFSAAKYFSKHNEWISGLISL